MLRIGCKSIDAWAFLFTQDRTQECVQLNLLPWQDKMQRSKGIAGTLQGQIQGKLQDSLFALQAASAQAWKCCGPSANRGVKVGTVQEAMLNQVLKLRAPLSKS